MLFFSFSTAGRFDANVPWQWRQKAGPHRQGSVAARHRLFSAIPLCLNGEACLVSLAVAAILPVLMRQIFLAAKRTFLAPNLCTQQRTWTAQRQLYFILLFSFLLIFFFFKLSKKRKAVFQWQVTWYLTASKQCRQRGSETAARKQNLPPVFCSDNYLQLP